MKQYLVIAYDFPDAIERRLEVRPQHFEEVRKMKAKNNFVKGGAILDEEEKMIGSVMLLQFENEHELNNWKENEPYIKYKVWERIEVKPFKVAEI
ncbi:YciI family protein [Rubrolithibacter danxiaensis]|uniref:YciI family protein n=1 Tax=Rubrolithibacter danxiaensis TaxID=3390805 RepID=UPI003BF8F3E7